MQFKKFPHPMLVELELTVFSKVSDSKIKAFSMFPCAMFSEDAIVLREEEKQILFFFPPHKRKKGLGPCA